MLDVLITVDVEIWPTDCARHSNAARAAFDRCILGRTPAGDFGLPHQLAVLGAHRLKAVFFVEALCADAIGRDLLDETVALIRGAGQEVQLHLHTEWLQAIGDAALPDRRGANIRDFTLDEQTALIGRGLDNLRASGADTVNAFRAGNYGADFNTLRALNRNGIAYDTSYNLCYLDAACGIATDAPLLQSTMIEGVREVPISFFEDRPGHMRHVQLGACSFAELSSLMAKAWRQRWQTFVMVSHGFELMNRRRDRADPIMVRRFDRLCRYLADNRDRFRTAGFHGLGAAERRPGDGAAILTSNIGATALRHVEQIARRLYL